MKTARWYAQGMLCLVTLWPLAGSGATSTNVIFPDPPRLATTAGALAALKASPGFEAVRATATNQAEAFLKKPVTVPDGFGDWYYISAENLRKFFLPIESLIACNSRVVNKRVATFNIVG